jgi:hypothetical protein
MSTRRVNARETVDFDSQYEYDGSHVEHVMIDCKQVKHVWVFFLESNMFYSMKFDDMNDETDQEGIGEAMEMFDMLETLIVKGALFPEIVGPKHPRGVLGRKFSHSDLVALMLIPPAKKQKPAREESEEQAQVCLFDCCFMATLAYASNLLCRLESRSSKQAKLPKRGPPNGWQLEVRGHRVCQQQECRFCTRPRSCCRWKRPPFSFGKQR